MFNQTQTDQPQRIVLDPKMIEATMQETLGEEQNLRQHDQALVEVQAKEPDRSNVRALGHTALQKAMRSEATPTANAS